VNKIANAGAKGCRLAVLYDGKTPDASGVVRYTSASSEWKELRANVKSDEAIQYLFIVMDCPDGGTTTVHIDDINFVPLAPEEPAFTPTDVARNGGFESGKDPWTLVGKAEVVQLVGVVPPDGDYYLRLYREGGTARQLLEMPAGTKVAGFNSYDIKFKYRLDSYYGGKANAGQPACRLDVSYDDEPPTKQVYLSAADVSKTWTELTVTVTNDADFIKAIQIDSYCGDTQNALADVYIDVVQVLSRAPETTTPPTTTPKKDDVCVNGGFEDGTESWTFASDAAIGTSYPKDGNGKKYAVLQGYTKDSISQQVQLPPDGTTGSGGFYQYVVKFEYRVFEYDFGGRANSGTCQIGVSHDDLPIADVDKRTIDSASGWGTYEATLTSDMDWVQNIKISTSCGGMASTLVAVDQVQVSCPSSLSYPPFLALIPCSSSCRRHTRQRRSRPTSPVTVGLRAARSSGPSQARAASARSTRSTICGTQSLRAAIRSARTSRCPTTHSTRATKRTRSSSSGMYSRTLRATQAPASARSTSPRTTPRSTPPSLHSTTRSVASSTSAQSSGRKRASSRTSASG
jgi:hypothetical protein